MRRKGLQVRHHARSATRIETRDRQENRRHADRLRVKMAHLRCLASFLEQNSRTRFSPARRFPPLRAEKRPAPANVRALIFVRKLNLTENPVAPDG